MNKKQKQIKHTINLAELLILELEDYLAEIESHKNDKYFYTSKHKCSIDRLRIELNNKIKKVLTQ